eukprot:PhF_6_TR6186/c0_g1_i1/m.9279
MKSFHVTISFLCFVILCAAIGKLILSESPKIDSVTTDDDEHKRSCLILQSNEVPTRCPREAEYVAEWVKRNPKKFSHHWVIVDVGANKGYSIAGMLEALGMDDVFSRRNLGLEIHALHHRLTAATENLCGACCDCMDPVIRQEMNDTLGVNRISIYAFDGSLKNVKWMSEYYTKRMKLYSGNQSRKRVRLDIHVRAAAISNEVGTTQFGQGEIGSELGSIDAWWSTKDNVINKTTLDAALPSYIDHIDVLLTDTEGHDYMVAEGAKRFIDTGKVGMYIFELQDKKRNVGSFIRRLGDLGYTCYFPLAGTFSPARRYVARVSRECWRPEYERFRGWYNAVCIHGSKHPELLAMFEEMEAATPKYDTRFRECNREEVIKSSESYKVD